MGNVLKRDIPPLVNIPETIDVPRAVEQRLDNGIKLLTVNSGDDPICRVDIILNAGSRYQQNNLQATAAISMLSEGTVQKTSQQISEFLDFHGSFIGLSADRDWGKVTLYSLKKYFSQSVELLAELLKNPSFPKEELHTWAARGKQKLTIELDRTSTLARQAFFNQLFGNEHPYGRFAVPADYDLLDSSMLKLFHQLHFGWKNATFVLSGLVEETEVEIVNRYFGLETWGVDTQPNCLPLANYEPKNGLVFTEKKNALQSAIRVGCKLFTRNHPDYPIVLLANTILGGYFGSRLMKNIREEKGYTYGINSHIVTLRDDGFFAIATEVGSQFTSLAINEIKNEIETLRSSLVSMEELQQVKSYMLGEALRSFNGPFAIADSTISLLSFNNLNYQFYNQLFNTIRNATPESILNAAQKWFNPNEMVFSVSGAEEPDWN